MYIHILVIMIAVIIFVFLFLTVVYSRVRIFFLRRKLQQSMHKNAETGNFLNIFSQNIENASEVNTWMNVTARYVADLIGAESVCIFTMEQDSLVATGVAGAFPPLHKTDAYVMTKPKYILEALSKEHIRLGEGMIGGLASSGGDLVITSSSDPRIVEIDPIKPINSLIAVPLQANGTIVGVICAINNKQDESKSFSSDQLGRLKFIAGQVVLAQNIVKVYSRLSEQQRISQELAFARNLQSALLPRSFPVWGCFSVHAFTRASKEVSGDFYDFVEIDQHRLLVVIGDACGKGIPACMIMSMTRSFIRSNSTRFTSLKDMLFELNENLFRDTGDERYITLSACLLDKREVTIECARAGHTESLMYVRGHIRSLNPDGTALGLLPSELSDFDTICTEFVQDMAVLLFTDGINEAVKAGGKEYFGIDRIKDLYVKSCVEHDTPEESIAKIMDEVDDFTDKPESQADDQTIVIIRHI